MKKGVIYKFILFRIKELICDSSSRPRFMTSFDRIIEDLFGVPKFSRKISNSYDNRDICTIIDLVGVESLLKILDNNYYYAIVNELIMVDFQIRATCKTLDKRKRSDNKRRKSLMKKKNYLVDLYRKSIKHLRKLLGIKNAETAYKRNFQMLNGLVNSRSYDDEFGFNFDYDFDDPYDDEYVVGKFNQRFDDEYESTSPLEDFVRSMNGDPVRRDPQGTVSRRNYSPASLNDSNFDPYDDYNRSATEAEDYDESDSRFERLSETVADLAGVVNALVNHKEHEVANPVSSDGPKNLSELYDEINEEEGSSYEGSSKIDEKLDAINDNQKLIAGVLENLIHWRDDVDGILQEILCIEDDEAVEYSEPEVEYEDPEILPKAKTREEMIDQLNTEAPVAGKPI